MSHSSELIAQDIEHYLQRHEQKELVRFITCGSVDDGKSTLIGRLLFDSKMIFDDQMAAIENESKKFNTTDLDFDLALLVDGLQSEREQGITIDVAYRYFSTEERKFIIADTPGHEQYTRNMVTGASTCDLAIILIDARHGVQVQTRRHSYICSLLGIKHLIVAVNKMDAVGYDQKVYQQIKQQYRQFASQLEIEDIRFVPISALHGDNVVNSSENMSWYPGSPLMKLLNTIQIKGAKEQDFRFSVQYVNRPNLDFRGFCGTVLSGEIQVGDNITVLPSGKSSKVKDIVTFDGRLQQAHAGMAITLTLEDEIDISRGDMLAHQSRTPISTFDIAADVVWMGEQPLHPDREYIIKAGSHSTIGVVTKVVDTTDVNTMERNEAAQLGLNEIGRCHFTFNEPLQIDNYHQNRQTGSFIIIDRLSNATVGAAMVIGEIAGIDGADVKHSQTTDYSVFELELNALICQHFPHWQAKNLN
ncbi:sulfate adenylyltransferase subunit CysN [Vibrio sp. SS-MA-C1-2]|uniref:sulfate adenylyltransferase subunit CysN n=1 Tax=Vibrio sp. SS-MA-C1-2 TaxID=2908646 RepID=UPI001F22F106|nr:sulfate adenylyltransferase subunit CysN [Vibrio sp. SS-MA-C1-2]UJF18004.1 sulfate adenylyltransferase subunit CysN [Vibrio sp. SS-MA-C1-2]